MGLFDNAALVIAAAALLVLLLQKLGQSSIVAFLLLGMVVGPHALNRVPSGEHVDLLAEIGVVLLLFFIGLEFHVAALRRMAALATAGALLQIALTTALVAAAGPLFGLTRVQGVVAGFCVALSSTAIVMKAFEDRKEADSQIAQGSLAILLGQDLAVMVALALATLLPHDAAAPMAELEGGPPHWLPPWAPLVGLPLLFFVARAVLPRLFAKVALSRNPEVFTLASLAACFLVAVGAQRLGANLALGAFLSGLVFADTAYAYQIRADLATVRNLALGLFFLSIGMLVDLGYVASHLLLLAGALIALLLVKTVAATAVFRLFRKPWSIAAGGGLALAQVSEFTFLLASGVVGQQLLGDEVRKVLVALAVLSMLPAPLLVGLSGRFGRAIAQAFGARGEPAGAAGATGATTPAAAAPPAERELAIVVGYGPVGRTLCRILLRLGVRVCVIDINPTSVSKLKQLKREAVFGDAGQREVLHAAGIERARWLIVTLPNQQTRATIIAMARGLAPRVKILTRARYLDEQSPLEQAGADQISYEEAEVAVELARLLLGNLGIRHEVLEQEVNAIRSEIAVRTGFTVIFARPPEPPSKPA